MQDNGTSDQNVIDISCKKNAASRTLTHDIFDSLRNAYIHRTIDEAYLGYFDPSYRVTARQVGTIIANGSDQTKKLMQLVVDSANATGAHRFWVRLISARAKKMYLTACMATHLADLTARGPLGTASAEVDLMVGWHEGGKTHDDYINFITTLQDHVLSKPENRETFRTILTEAAKVDPARAVIRVETSWQPRPS